MKKHIIIIVIIACFIFIARDINKTETISYNNYQPFCFEDTVKVKNLNLKNDSVLNLHEGIKNKEPKLQLKGRLKLSKQRTNKSREYGGFYINESLMYRTR